MSEENKNLPVKQDDNVLKEAENELFEGILEEIGPKIKKLVKPGKKWLLKELGDDEKMFIIRRNKGTNDIVLLAIDIEGIPEDLEFDEKHVKAYSIDHFIDMFFSLKI